MSLFRVTEEKPFKGPHQNQPIKTGGLDISEAAVAMLLVHGRGASAESMLQFAGEFNRPDIHYRALQASGHTWYPRSFLAPIEMNEPGISSGLQSIYDQIAVVNKEGIPKQRIILLGFSQGACLATEFTARHPQKLGGVIGLSGGLIGDKIDPDNYSGSLDDTPVFLGCSDRDPHIPRGRVDETEQIFNQLNATVTKRIYQGMGHTVNEDEIAFVQKLIDRVVE